MLEKAIRRQRLGSGYRSLVRKTGPRRNWPFLQISAPGASGPSVLPIRSCSVPGISVAFLRLVGTPRFQFPSVNQSEEAVPVQLVVICASVCFDPNKDMASTDATTVPIDARGKVFGGSGRMDPIASKNCAALAYQSSMQRSRPVRRPGSGVCPDIPRFNKHCATATSTLSLSPASMFLPKLNPVEPPWYGPVCPVVWEGWHREVSPYPDHRRILHVPAHPRAGPRLTRYPAFGIGRRNES